jgi:outer membrane immunogenic protein
VEVTQVGPLSTVVTQPGTTTGPGLVGPLAGGSAGKATIDALATLPGQDISISTQGFVGGGQIGYNYQTGNWVLGAEADLSAGNLRGNHSIGELGIETKIDWFGTVRGRGGYASGGVLAYGTAGIAAGDVLIEYSLAGLSVSDQALQFGWTVGGGLEMKLTEVTSVKAEFKHIDLGVQTFLEAAGYDARLSTQFEIGVIGLNYRF